MSGPLIRSVWVLEIAKPLMVVSTSERADGDEVTLVREAPDTVRAALKLYHAPAPTPRPPRRKPCPWVRVAPAEFSASNHPATIVLGTFPAHCPVCNGKPTLGPRGIV